LFLLCILIPLPTSHLAVNAQFTASPSPRGPTDDSDLSVAGRRAAAAAAAAVTRKNSLVLLLFFARALHVSKPESRFALTLPNSFGFVPGSLTSGYYE
jgi:hypothetical protein